MRGHVYSTHYIELGDTIKIELLGTQKLIVRMMVNNRALLDVPRTVARVLANRYLKLGEEKTEIAQVETL